MAHWRNGRRACLRSKYLRVYRFESDVGYVAYRDKEHQRAAGLARATEKRIALGVYKVEKGCVDCGYNEDARALEFDHLPGSDKTRTVASLLYASWNRVWEEIAKCEVVCANCHAIRTMDRLGL